MAMMNIHKFASEIFFLLLLTSFIIISSNAIEEDERKNNNNNNNNIRSDDPLGRVLVQLFLHQNKELNKKFSSSWSTIETNIKSEVLRRLGNNNINNNNNNNKIKERFGPGNDWSCTAKGAINYDSCVQQKEGVGEDEGSDTSSSSCAWCPFGSTNGICLRTDQAELVNGLENDHLLHLKCYNNNIEQEQLHSDVEIMTKFWNEAIACHPHNSQNCAGDHHNNGDDDRDHDHVCTWCTVSEPAMGMCISQSLWDNLVVAQALEEFDNDVSTNDQIRIDQVIHCAGNGGSDGGSDSSSSSSSSNNDIVSSLWDTTTTTCRLSSVVDCISTMDDDGNGSKSCVVQTNPFPGLFGIAGGKYCVSQQQQRFILWMVELLRDMGWEKVSSD